MCDMTAAVLGYIKEEYGAEPEYLWQNDTTAAIRHSDTKKWFGAYIKALPRVKLGMEKDGSCDILLLKCDPIYRYSVVDNEGIFPGWHMNKEHWISVLLDGTVPLEEITPLINMSFVLTSKKKRGSLTK